MMIDIQLLKLQYEILNIPLEQLAQEISVPKSLLDTEARNNNWTQWWPEQLQGDIIFNSPAPPFDVISEAQMDEEASVLEEGAQQYIRDTQIRLRVYNLAKEVYLTHKYATFESSLITKAKDIIDSVATAQELAQLSSMFKNLLPSGKSGQQLSIGQNEDGLPTVIIRDLTGRETA